MSINNLKAGEEKIFINGPSGQLETLVYGLPNISAFVKDKTVDPDNPIPNLDAMNLYPNLKTIGVVCHPHPLYQGTMHNKVVTTICKAWQNLAMPTVRFNFRGVGESEGHYNQGVGERMDLEAVLSFFQGIFPDIQFWLAGFSFGSYIALQVAAEPKTFPVQALLSVAPPVHHFAFDKTLLPTCPWVIIQGTADSVVPYEKVLNWAKDLELKKSNLKFISMEGAEHFFHGRLVELNTIIQDNFRKFQ